ncbi:MAG: extracellular solute-binding protein [Alphaproteobacteria bacterium]
MRKQLSRRTFLRGTAAGGLAAGLVGAWPGGRRAWAKDPVTAVDWGNPYLDASKAMAERQGKLDVTWVAHEGGGAAILAKIKATWPNTPYDVIDNWSPVFITMMREGWAETVTLNDVPNLADVPEGLIAKDDKGNWKNIPRSTSGACFAYNPEKSPVEIKSLQDLFNPKLKGQIAWPGPVMNTSLQVVAFALANGGNERNMDPGFKLLQDLAKTGNIGRVYTVHTEAVASMTSGETSVLFGDQGTLSPIAAAGPLKYVTKSDPMLKTFFLTEGWIVMSNSKKKQAAFELANFSISPDECFAFNTAIGLNPANKKSKPIKGLEHLVFSDDEIKTFGYFPDYDLMSKQVDGWVKRFESEITPLLK